MKPQPQIVVRAAALGVATGGRSTAGVAALAAMTPAAVGRGRQPLAALTGDRATRVAALLLLGELVADKLPSTPSRLTPPVLLVRLAAGGLAAVALAQREGASPVLPAVLGAAGAAAGSVLGLRYREAAARRGAALPAALVEDAVVLGIASAATRR